MSARRPSAPASRGPESPARQRRAPQRHPGEESSSAADESDDALPVPQYSSADDDDDDASLSSLLSTESIAAPLLDEQFLPRLVAVFWAVFHPTEGPKVVYQVPDGAVVPQAQAQPPLVPPRLSSSRPASPRRAAAPSAAAPAPPPLFDWAALKDYLIPKEPLCGHLVTCLASAAALEPGTPTHPGAYGAQAFKVLAYPVLMHDEDKYARNTFIFNLAFVFDAKSDVRAYEPVVRKCARTLRYLEDSKSFLSSPRSQPRMYGLIEQLYEDLNSYCETFIALPDAPHTRYLDKPGANTGGAGGAGRSMRGGVVTRNGRAATGGQSSMPSSPFAGLPAGGLAMTRRRSSGGGSAGVPGKDGADGVAMTPMSSIGVSDASVQELSAAVQAARLAAVPPLHLGDPVLLNSQLAEAEAVMSGGGPATPLTKLRVADLALTALGGSGTGSASTSPRPRVARANTVDLMSPLSTLSMRRSSLAPSAQSSDDEGGSRDEAKARTPSRSSSGDQGMRPSLGRSKTLAALGFSGTTVSTMSASVNDNRDAASSGATTPAGETAPMLRAATSSDIVPGTPLPPSSGLPETGAADRRGSRERHSAGREALKDGILSLRTIGAATASNVGGSVPAAAASNMTASSSVASAMPLSTSVGALAPALMLAPGKREPPHGLGRTVRDAINLKLFPTYANPPPVKDWDVPVALLDLKGKNEGNWDLTMAKIFPFIDGVNHVKRIAQLADADLELTRQCMEHLLFYSCIITLDIFAFSNMYSLRPAIAIMAEDESIQRECGAYVSRAGSAVPSWPKLLQLYSALRPGITLHDWIDSHDVDELGIDVRRFVTFGVIKGFLRRVHRYPILLAVPLTEERSTARSPVRREARGGTEGPQGFSTFSMIPGLEAGRKHASPSPLGRARMQAAQEEGQGSGSSRERPALNRSGDTARPLVPAGEGDGGSAKATAGTQEASGATPQSATQTAIRPRRRGRREASENGSLLTLDASMSGTSPSKRAPGSARNVRAAMHRHATATVVDVASVALDLSRPPDEAAPPTPGAQRVLREWKSNSSMHAWTRTLSGGIPSHSNARAGDSAFSRLADGSHAGTNKSTMGETTQQPYVPPELGSLCDGTRPEDELCVRFGISWSELHQLLLILGRPSGAAGTGGSTARERSSMAPGDSTWTLPQQGAHADWGEEEMANASGFTGASAIAYPGAQAGGTLGRRSVGNSTLASASGFARPPNALRRHGSQEQNARGGRDDDEDGTSMGHASTAATNWPSAVLAEATAAGDYGLIRIILQ